ncbi:MAG TPA: hypothetical protein VNZ22_09495, partial [Bacillota bacterium]|nr:hypothetical protein [Bacillota bacterium]
DASGRPFSRHWGFSLWNLVFFTAGVLLCLMAGYLGVLHLGGARAAAAQGGARNVAPSPNRPWGELEAIPIFLERPKEYSSSPTPVPAQLQWFFPRQTLPQLSTFFRKCGLPEHQSRALSDTNRWQITPTEVVITPPLEVVRDMEPVPRERIYRALARSAKNGEHRYPYYSDQGFDQWFAGCSLPQEKLDLIRRMTYTRNGILCFSDAEFLQMTFAREEMREVSETLSRVPSLLVRLHITPQTDVDALLNYWGSSSRTSKIKPLLESAKRVPEGTTLNISWFFPPVPRLLLYSYPNPTNTIAGKYPDCYWTALNFFNDTPDNRLLGEAAGETLHTGYESIPKAERFGDVILLYQREGEEVITVHTCIFVAEDIVFTKNGYDLRQPWVLMRMEDMMFKYVTDKSVGIAAFRSKHR